MSCLHLYEIPWNVVLDLPPLYSLDINAFLKVVLIRARSHYLKYDIGQHHHEREGQVEQQPDLHWLDVRGGGQVGGDGQVDRGQDHHAGSDQKKG